MKWTEDQQKAISAQPAGIVVSAAAGSGKTQVLTTRIIERLKNTQQGVSVDKLLIVTFTKAAAAEMKERIGKSLSRAARDEQNAEKKAYLTRQLSLLGSASICTIDSFCYNVLRQNFYRVDLPADISIGETGELALLRVEALEQTVDALYSAMLSHKGAELSAETAQCGDIVRTLFPQEKELSIVLEGFERLTECYASDKADSDFSGSRQGGDYTTMISELHRLAQAAAFPQKWLTQISDYYNCEKYDYTQTPFYSDTISCCKKMAQSIAELAKNGAELSESFGIGYETVLYPENEYFLQAAETNDYDALRKMLYENNPFAKLPSKKRGTDSDAADTIKTLRKKEKDLSGDCAKLLEIPLDKCRELQSELYPVIKALCAGAMVLDALYYEKMTARRIVDFTTCEHLAMKIISPDGESLSEAGEVIRDRFDEIYIDEMQDSNTLQDTLFSMISKGRMFMVGDVKQSIYRFRSADPTIFMKKCADASFEASAEKRKIFLSKNFRSRSSVITAVNSAFDVLMREDTCGIDYKKEHRLDFGADFMSGAENEMPAELDIIRCDGNAQEAVQLEAEFIAKKISELVSSGEKIWDKDESIMRPIKYSDIVILMRSANKEAELYGGILSAYGIPTYYDGGGSFYTSGEVGGILELLKLIDNAENDIPLASTLRSPMFMFNENELVAIRLCDGGSFCAAMEAVCAGKAKTDSALTQKCISFMKTVEKWRRASKFLTVEELIRRIYNETNITSTVLSFPDGEKRRANLELLLERAAEFEKSSFRGLFNFVNYVDKLQRNKSNSAEAKSVSSKMDVVRIMSIHKSKGLEFPVVFLSECEKNFYGSDKNPGGMVINMKSGISINVTNPDLRCRYSSPMQRIATHIEKTENAAEEMRLLYVALTRARERLFVVCAAKINASFDAPPYKYLPAYEIMTANSYGKLLRLSGDKFIKVEYNAQNAQPEDSARSAQQDVSFASNDEISKLLDYSYPYSYAVKLPNKASVSYLKTTEINLIPESDGTIHDLDAVAYKSVKLQKLQLDKKLSGAFYGTAHHKMLENIRFDGTSVAVQRCEMLEAGILSADEEAIIDNKKIEAFIGSELGQRMKKAARIYRESPFVINISASELSPSIPKDETICVQGVIDCWFEENEKIVIVDYKTDYYDDPNELKEKYEKQLLYYEKALKSKFNNKLIEKYLYLLHKNDIIRL